jgi:hypothetical protein
MRHNEREPLFSVFTAGLMSPLSSVPGSLPTLLIVPNADTRSASMNLAIDVQHTARTEVFHYGVAVSTVKVGEDQFLSSSESCVRSSDEMVLPVPPVLSPLPAPCVPLIPLPRAPTYTTFRVLQPSPHRSSRHHS